MMKPKRSKKAIQNPKSSLKGDDDDDREHGLADLPECLQHEILTSLPLKTIFMFKCVSKRWNSFISTPDFSKSYIATKEFFSPNRTLLLLCSNHRRVLIPPINYDDDDVETVCTYSTMNQRLSSMNNELPFTMLDFPFPKLQPDQISHQPYIVVSSCNGLLLCSTYKNEIVYGICNPITRQWIVLPRHKGCYDDIFMREAFVAKIDKLCSKLISYRVVRLKVGQSLLSALRMEIYDSDKKKWTKSKVKLPGRDFYITVEGLQPAYLNEIIHWEVQLGEVHYAIAVDPYKHDEDQCRLMVLPTATIFSSKTTWDTLLGVCNGRLQYLKIHKESHDMAIWVLEDYDEEKWELKYMITCINLTYPQEIGDEVCRPLAFHPLNSNIIYIHCTTVFTTMIAFDIEKKTLIPLSSTRVCSYTEVFPFVLPLWPPVFDCPYTTTNLY